MKRYRLVSQQSNAPQPHVSDVAMDKHEAAEQLDAEALIHQLSGWTVTRGDNIVVCRRGDTTRVITIQKGAPG